MDTNCEICQLPDECDVWESMDDVGGDDGGFAGGEQTFYRECIGLPKGHAGAHNWTEWG